MEGHFSALKQAPFFGLIKLILDREWLDRQEIRHISAIANNSILLYVTTRGAEFEAHTSGVNRGCFLSLKFWNIATRPVRMGHGAHASTLTTRVLRGCKTLLYATTNGAAFTAHVQGVQSSPLFGIEA